MIQKIDIQDYNAQIPEGIAVKLKGMDNNHADVICNPGLKDMGVIDGNNLRNAYNAFGFCSSTDGSGFAGMFLSINKTNIDSSISGFQLKVSLNNDNDPMVKIRVIEGDGVYEVSNWFSISLK